MLAIDNTWKCMKEGSKSAFLHIYEEHYKFLFCYGFSLTHDRELTKDCIQELFLELWDTKDTVSQVQNVRSFLCTWLRRKSSCIQSRNTKAKLLEAFSQDPEVNQGSYLEVLVACQEKEENKLRLSNALSHLTKKQLEIIKLKFFENLSYEEMAAKTTLSNRTLYNTIFLAIQQLKKDFSIPQPT